ncbi:MAG TPA: immunoglobulin domain-containing protein, partial [Bacillota bacterium]|nr:immunoglobulin domain-containing protein [Bacillota bacterium]
MSWWPADGNANDIAGSSNGSLQGGATAVASGLVAQAFGFNGATAFVQIPDSPALRPTNFTVEAWVLFTSLNSSGNSPAGQQYIVFKQNTRNSYFEGIYLGKERRTGGDVFSFGVSSASGQFVGIDSSPIIATGVWYHVAGVRGPNFLQLYLNGVLVGQVSVSFPQNYGTLPLYFGTSGQSYWDHKLAGLLDEVALYNRVLSASEIAAIHAAGSAGKCKTTPDPAIITQPQNQNVIVGGNAAFTVTATGTAPLSYQWLRNGLFLSNGGTISGATSSALTLANVQPADAGNYTVIVSNAIGTSVTSAVAVLTVLGPPVIIAQPQSRTNLAGTTASFSVGVTGSAPLSFQWRSNGVNLANSARISGSTTATLSIASVQPADAADYSVLVTNAAGAIASVVATLTVRVPPTITTPPASRNVNAGTDVSFSATAAGTQPLSYQWLFNASPLVDGAQLSGTTTPTLWVTNAQPANQGSYAVVVTNLAGAVTSAVATLTLIVPGSCSAPPAGLVSWWPADGNANDIAGSSNGSLQGGATAVASGLVAQAFGFN